MLFIGLIFAGSIFDMTGSYGIALGEYVIAAAIGLGLMHSLPPYPRGRERLGRLR